MYSHAWKRGIYVEWLGIQENPTHQGWAAGKGYGKQAVLSLLDRLHTEYQSGTVYLSVYENNPHAIKLYQQIGFRFNGKYDSKGEHIMEYHF